MQCIKFFDGRAFLFYILKFMFSEVMELCSIVQIQLGNHGSNLTEEELETHTISAWKEGKAHLTQQISASYDSYLNRLVRVSNFFVDRSTTHNLWSIFLLFSMYFPIWLCSYLTFELLACYGDYFDTYFL